MKTAPWLQSAVETVAQLRNGTLRPQALLDAVEERVAAVDPIVNALPTLCFDRARAAAGRQGLDDTLLGGLPVPIKDSYPVAGVRTTWGSRAFARHVPDRSDYVVEALEAAGALVFAKSNTPEFEAGANTFNEVFGATRNPWDGALSAAGSSGGAAVAVATGMAHIAQGSDFACSLRYPAAFCGVVGLRPSLGLVPQGPSPVPWQTLSVLGPLARSVADAGLGLAAMCRFDPRDPLSRPLRAADYAAAAAESASGRFAFSPDLGIAIVDDEIAAVVESAVVRLSAAGAAARRASPAMAEAHDAFRPLRAFQFAAARADLIEGASRKLLKPEVVWNVEQGLKLDAAAIARAYGAQARLRGGLLDFLSEHDFLVTPTAPVAPFPVEERYVRRIGGRDMETYLDWLVLGYAVTVTGCPAISIPCGFTRSGLPVGLQIVAPPYREAKLLSFAAWCERVFDLGLGEPIDPRPALSSTADKAC